MRGYSRKQLRLPAEDSVDQSRQRVRFVEQINSFLPPDIRVHGMTKVSKGFNAKNFCGKRRYHYLLPTYMLLDSKVTNEKLSAAYKLQGPISGAGYEGVSHWTPMYTDRSFCKWYCNVKGFVEASSTQSLTAESLSKVRSNITSYRASIGTYIFLLLRGTPRIHALLSCSYLYILKNGTPSKFSCML